MSKTPLSGGGHGPAASSAPQTDDPIARVLAVAVELSGRPFSETFKRKNGHYLEAYCAAFTRWCFERGLGLPQGRLPIEQRPPYYQAHGIHYVGGEYTADGLAGDRIGRHVKNSEVSRGDILLFKDTCRGFVRGTITHVGIATSATEMYHAGGGSQVYKLNFNRAFHGGSGELIEVRRPHVFGNAKALDALEKGGTRLVYSGSVLAAKVRGRPVRDVKFYVSQSGQVSIDGKPVKCKVVSLEVEFKDGSWIKHHQHDGKVHDHRFFGIHLKLTNGLLEVSPDMLVNPFTGMKVSDGFRPKSVQFAVWE
jgi:hypothetical protein